MRNKIILTITILLICLPVFSEEIKKEDKKNTFYKYSFGYSVGFKFEPYLLTQIKNPFTEISSFKISFFHNFNDYFKLGISNTVDKFNTKSKSSPGLGLEYKYYPFTEKNLFFIENGYIFSVDRKYYNKDSYNDEASLIFSIGIGSKFVILKEPNESFELALIYKNIMDFKEKNNYFQNGTINLTISPMINFNTLEDFKSIFVLKSWPSKNSFNHVKEW